ncbi:MAG: Uncharacterised protein [Bacteroidota bacterium]|nr:MAG: Uncharacterised protein [Bacteroidota bacterium]
MNEIEVFNGTQLALIANGIYLVTFTALVFITFRLIRFQRENQANIFGKILVTIFGLCSTFYGYSVFSFLRNIQLGQSYRLSALKESGVELTPWAQSIVDFTQYTVQDGLPLPFSPEPAAVVFVATFAVMIIAGVWLNLSKSE